jgi:hypothetical protein
MFLRPLPRTHESADGRGGGSCETYNGNNRSNYNEAAQKNSTSNYNDRPIGGNLKLTEQVLSYCIQMERGDW